MTHTWRRGSFEISTDKSRLDLESIRALLATSYWAANRTAEQIARAIEHSLVFGLYHEGRQIGLARVVTDYVSCAYLADVIVHEGYRGQGLGQWLIEIIVDHPDLQAVRRWLLITRDAQELYRRFGFESLQDPERYMERPGPAPTRGNHDSQR